MKRLFSIAVVLSAFFSTSANAFFFFFLPGSVTGAITDAVTGSEGENCVGTNAKVGDLIREANGDMKKVKSLSGTSMRCTNSEWPIRALLEASAQTVPLHISKAGIDLPETWTPQPLSDAMKAESAKLLAVHRNTDTWLLLGAISHQGITDMTAVAVARRSNLANRLTETQQSDISQSLINGIPVWRFTLSGKLKSGIHVTYLMTIFDTEKEIVFLNTWTLFSGFASQREMMEKLSERISGLTPSISTAVSPPIQQSPPATPQPVAVETPSASPAAVASSDQPTSTAPSKVLSSTPVPAVLPATRPATAESSSVQRLRDLNTLYKDGLITQEDFDAKKHEILKSM